MGEKKQCPFPDIKDPSMVYEYEDTETMIGFHIEGQHCKADPAAQKKEKKESEKKKAKRVDVKPPNIMESETREEFRS